MKIRHTYEVPGIILLQTVMFTYSLLKEVMIKLGSLNCYTLHPSNAVTAGNIYGTPIS
jgi:hypothetical protein